MSNNQKKMVYGNTKNREFTIKFDHNLYLPLFLCVLCAFALNTYSVAFAAQQSPGVERMKAGIESYENGSYEDAIFKLEMALIELPQDDKENTWEAHFYLGLSYYLSGEDEQAKNAFNKAKDIIKNRFPDPDIHSPKIVKLFEEVIEHTKIVKDEKIKTYADSVTGMEFVLVNGGCFEMGDTFGDGDSDERPVHEVCVDNFYIGKYEVTQGQWEEVMGSNPSVFKKGHNYPVEHVSWNDVQEFIRKLNRKTGKNYRLPTEAEWEYAARSRGKKEKWAGTSTKSELREYAWYSKNSKGKTHPVGQKRPNSLGLYDMSGNVWERVQDIYSKKAYRKHQRNNPIYKENGSDRVIRGGSWYNNPDYLRAANRFFDLPDYRDGYVGFRLSRSP